MIGKGKSSPIRALHWTVGLVILLEAYRTFSSALPRLHDGGHAGTLAWVRLGISGPEMVAALLFLIPFTMVVGSYGLLIIIALAIAIHGLHGEFAGLETLVLYAVAVFVVMRERRDRVGDTASKSRVNV